METLNSENDRNASPRAANSATDEALVRQILSEPRRDQTPVRKVEWKFFDVLILPWIAFGAIALQQRGLFPSRDGLALSIGISTIILLKWAFSYVSNRRRWESLRVYRIARAILVISLHFVFLSFVLILQLKGFYTWHALVFCIGFDIIVSFGWVFPGISNRRHLGSLRAYRVAHTILGIFPYFVLLNYALIISELVLGAVNKDQAWGKAFVFLLLSTVILFGISIISFLIASWWNEPIEDALAKFKKRTATHNAQ